MPRIAKSLSALEVERLREMALAHAIGNETEEAYRRGDLFDKRRVLMEMWAKCHGHRTERAWNRSGIQDA